MSDELIAAADVVCSTLIGCGCDALLQSSFDIVRAARPQCLVAVEVVIDEASQATEPRCLVALQPLASSEGPVKSLRKARRQFIMVGDQMLASIQSC